MRKVIFGFYLMLLLMNNIVAEEIYRIERFKKSNKISSRSIMVNGEFLKQSYDLSGRLIIETYTKGNIVSSVCFTKNGLKIDSAGEDSEKYFTCLQSFSELATSENGIIEEKPRKKKRAI